MTGTPDIRFLVFSGGGAAGPAYAGAIEEFLKKVSLEKIQAIAGTSIGSLAALMVSLKYDPQVIIDKLFHLDFKKFEDGGCPPNQVYRLVTEYARFKGEVLLELIKDIIKEKIPGKNPEEVTFADLKKLGYKDLYVVATKMYKENNKPMGKEKVFSYEKTPHTSVAMAIRASCAAPIFFTGVRLKKTSPGKYEVNDLGHLYDDGGLLNNFPIDIFDKPRYLGLQDNGTTSIVNPHTLGFVLLHTSQLNNENHKPTKTPINDNHPFEYAEGVVNTLMHQFETEKLDKVENRKRAIQIDRKGVGLSDFNISQKKKKELIESGRFAVKSYFAHLEAIEAQKQAQSTEYSNDNNNSGIYLVQNNSTLWKAPKEVPMMESVAEQKKKHRRCVIV